MKVDASGRAEVKTCQFEGHIFPRKTEKLLNAEIELQTSNLTKFQSQCIASQQLYPALSSFPNCACETSNQFSFWANGYEVFGLNY